MTRAEKLKLETILAKVEALQNQTNDLDLKQRLADAKTELLRAWKVD